jgi:hypothetical protein
MMRTFNYCLLIISVFALSFLSCKKKTDTPAKPIDTTGTPASQSWIETGKIDAATPNAHAVIRFDNNGIAYLLYQDGKNGNKATVQKWENLTWKKVGDAGFSDGIASYPDMAISNDGKLFVSYLETSATQVNKIRVMAFGTDRWLPVGNALFAGTATTKPALSLDKTGAVCLAYIAPPAVGKAQKFDGTSWSEYFVSDPTKSIRSIDIAGGTEYLGYIWDTTLGISSFDMLKYNGSAWTTLSFPGNKQLTSFTLTLDNKGNPIVAGEGKSPARLASVYKWDNSWVNIGTDFSNGIAATPSIAYAKDSASTPYIVYRNGNNKAVIMHYSEGEWKQPAGGFISGTLSHIDVSVHPLTHKPYVACSGTDGKVIVMQLE